MSVTALLEVHAVRRAFPRPDERASHRAPKSRFFDELEDHMTASAAEETLRAVIGWGRYAEAYAYDDDEEMFSLENPS